MQQPHIVRNPQHHKLGVAVVLTFLIGVASAEAQEVHTFPGSSCQASGSAQDLYYSGVSVANRGNSTSSVVCPIVRTNGTEPWSLIAVYVRDRHSTANITCVAQARDLSGTAGTGWSETQSSAGEGDQVLVFAAPGSDPPDFGRYVVVCSIPAMEEVNQPSYVALYVYRRAVNPSEGGVGLPHCSRGLLRFTSRGQHLDGLHRDTLCRCRGRLWIGRSSHARQ